MDDAENNQESSDYPATQTGQLGEFFIYLQQVLAPATYPMIFRSEEIEDEPEHTQLIFTTDFPAKFEDVNEDWNYNAVIQKILGRNATHQNIRHAHYFARDYPTRIFYWWTYERELNILAPKIALREQTLASTLFPEMENDERANTSQGYRKQVFLKVIYSIAQAVREEQQAKISDLIQELSGHQKISRALDRDLVRWSKMVAI